MLVDQFLETFGRAWLDLRFRTTTFNTIVDACDIRLRGCGIDGGIVPGDHREGGVVRSCGGVVESRRLSGEVLSREGREGRRGRRMKRVHM